ncbi:MAG TPA: carbohydrate kinase family protein [Longimicrobiales bacterium]|nr:carbohydrate kinase family protein [Longimicrobiales bacterium]
MRLGVLGTMVWDRIHARDGRAGPVEEWGGITYALAAASAAIPPAWEIVPILKVGEDLSERAFRFLRSLPDVNLARIRVVAEPTNRVELRYLDRERRFERLTGGLSAWQWPDLGPALADLDALYVNFISGFELTLETAQQLRLSFHGPVYADLHSLLLGITPTGTRVPRPLEAWREWLRCFDVAQVNEDELATLAQLWGDPWRFAAEVVGHELRLLLVTLGARGAAYVAAPGLEADPLSWRARGLVVPQPLLGGGAAKSERMAAPVTGEDGDPTGCGDVWGATFFCRLLAERDLARAMRAANQAAARNVMHRGATGLREHLLGQFGT